MESVWVSRRPWHTNRCELRKHTEQREAHNSPVLPQPKLLEWLRTAPRISEVLADSSGVPDARLQVSFHTESYSPCAQQSWPSPGPCAHKVQINSGCISDTANQYWAILLWDCSELHFVQQISIIHTCSCATEVYWFKKTHDDSEVWLPNANVLSVWGGGHLTSKLQFSESNRTDPRAECHQ